MVGPGHQVQVPLPQPDPSEAGLSCHFSRPCSPEELPPHTSSHFGRLGSRQRLAFVLCPVRLKEGRARAHPGPPRGACLSPKCPSPLRDAGTSWVVPGVLLVQADPSSKVRVQLVRVCSGVVVGPEDLTDRGEVPHFPRAQDLAGPLRSKRGPGKIWSQTATGSETGMLAWNLPSGS